MPVATSKSSGLRRRQITDCVLSRRTPCTVYDPGSGCAAFSRANIMAATGLSTPSQISCIGRSTYIKMRYVQVSSIYICKLTGPRHKAGIYLVSDLAIFLHILQTPATLSACAVHRSHIQLGSSIIDANPWLSPPPAPPSNSSLQAGLHQALSSNCCAPHPIGQFCVAAPASFATRLVVGLLLSPSFFLKYVLYYVRTDGMPADF